MGEPAVHHGGEVIEGGWFVVLLWHMYSSIARLAVVSMEGMDGDAGLYLSLGDRGEETGSGKNRG
jgi:hypothetical protein